MRKRTKVAVVILACTVCVALVAGVAYAAAPSFAEAGEEVAEQQAAAEDAATDQAMADSYLQQAQTLSLSSHDADGAYINQPSTIPSLLNAQANSGAHLQDKVPLQAATSSSASQSSAAQSLPSCSLVISGNVIPYVDAYKAERAPDHTAGLWMGSDSTQDGSWGYFIGHHPGVFNCVMYLQQGDTIQVCDRDGNERTYTVFEVYDVPDSTQWSQIASDVTSHGESITIQTCCGDEASYRIVEAA